MVIDDKTKFFCTNNACGQTYTNADNKEGNQCIYHKGVWQFGSHHVRNIVFYIIIGNL